MKKSERIAILEEKVAVLERRLDFTPNPNKQESMETGVKSLDNKYDEVTKGSWYWFEKNIRGHIQDALIFVNDITMSMNGNYGFDHAGKWIDGTEDGYTYAVYNNLKTARRASPQEVEEALIKEAKRRGLLHGVRFVSPNGEDWDFKVTSNDFHFDAVNNTLSFTQYLGGEVFLFMDGHWAEPIIEKDKFAELKEAQRNGKNIECRLRYSDCTWIEKTHVGFFHKFEYRIKPEEEPKCGDVVKAWYNKGDGFVVGILNEIRPTNNPFPYLVSGSWFENVKALNKQEAIDLLFGKQ